MVSSGSSPSTNGFTGNASSNTANIFAVFAGLTAGATYYVDVQAINNNGVGTAFVALGSTTTSPAASAPVGSGGGTVSFTQAAGTDLVQIPGGTFSQTVTVTVNAPSSFPAPTAAIPLTGTGVGIQITLDQAVQPAVNATISISYRPSDVAGLDESRLMIARYDPPSGLWVPLVSSPDPAAHSVSAQTNHFSLFQVMQANPSSSATSARAYPNPLRPTLGENSMTFAQLPANARVRIYTLRGALVKDLSANDSGMASWDGTNQAGVNAASGVYFVLAQGNGTAATLEVAIQR